MDVFDKMQGERKFKALDLPDGAIGYSEQLKIYGKYMDAARDGRMFEMNPSSHELTPEIAKDFSEKYMKILCDVVNFGVEDNARETRTTLYDADMAASKAIGKARTLLDPAGKGLETLEAIDAAAGAYMSEMNKAEYDDMLKGMAKEGYGTPDDTGRLSLEGALYAIRYGMQHLSEPVAGSLYDEMPSDDCRYVVNIFCNLQNAIEDIDQIESEACKQAVAARQPGIETQTTISERSMDEDEKALYDTLYGDISRGAAIRDKYANGQTAAAINRSVNDRFRDGALVRSNPTLPIGDNAAAYQDPHAAEDKNKAYAMQNRKVGSSMGDVGKLLSSRATPLGAINRIVEDSEDSGDGKDAADRDITEN